MTSSNCTIKNAGALWYHGSRSGSLDLERGHGNFGGGLFLAKDKIYARDYASGGSYSNVFLVRLRKGARVFRPSSQQAVRKLARYLKKHYDRYDDFDMTVDNLSVEDLQSNSLYDEVQVQEALDAMHYRVVVTHSEALVLDPIATVVGVRRLDENGKRTSQRNPRQAGGQWIEASAVRVTAKGGGSFTVEVRR